MVIDAKLPKWVSKLGITCPKCVLNDFDGAGGRGVAAAAAIEQDEVVVSVPDDAVLMPETCSALDALEEQGLCNVFGDPEANLLGLVLAVMIERQRGTNSRWRDYLAFLPDSLPGMPMFWSLPALASLAGTALHDKLAGSKAVPGCYVEPPCQVRERFDRHVAPFLHGHPQQGLPPGALATYAAYMWATAVVSAYSFTIGDDAFQAMVPFWDALNHVTGRANVRLHHCPRSGSLQMLATRRIEAGEQVINCFGDLSNSELLRRYGFVEAEANPHDCAEIALADVLEATGHGVALQTVSCSAADGHGRHGHDSSRRQPLRAARPSDSAAADRRLAFLWRSGLVPKDGWYRISIQGVPCTELVEAVRLCLLPEGRFDAFARGVAAWRVPRVRPLARAAVADVPAGLAAVLHELCADRLLELNSDARKVSANALSQTEDGIATAVIAAAVRRSEAAALRSFRQWLNNKSGSGQLIAFCADFWRLPRTQL